MKVKETKEGCWYKGQFIPLWGGLYSNTSQEFFRGALPGLSRTLKCDDSACVCVEELIDNDMEKSYKVISLERVGSYSASGLDDSGLSIKVSYEGGWDATVQVSMFHQSPAQAFSNLRNALRGLENPEETYGMFIPLYEGFVLHVAAFGFDELPQNLREPKIPLLSDDERKAIIKRVRIRKLTPKTCWRLMGCKDDDFEKAKAAGISDSRLYQLAGNSIVVNVLEGIFTQLFREDNECLF